MRKADVIPEGCNPGFGCFNCPLPDCEYQGCRVKSESLNEKSPAAAATTTRHKAKKSLANHSTNKKRVNSKSRMVDWNLWMYGGSGLYAKC